MQNALESQPLQFAVVLKSLDLVIKKSLTYKESCPEEQAKYKEIVERLNPEDIVYVDESGVEKSICSLYAWSRKGQPVVDKKSGIRKARTNIVGGLVKNKPIALMSFEGSCTAEFFNGWLEEFLLPELTPGMTVVMDNGSFHHSPETRRLIEAAGCELLYLPPYSPELNPIEKFWARMKLWLRSARSGFESFAETLKACFAHYSS